MKERNGRESTVINCPCSSSRYHQPATPKGLEVVAQVVSGPGTTIESWVSHPGVDVTWVRLVALMQFATAALGTNGKRRLEVMVGSESVMLEFTVSKSKIAR